MTDRPIRIQRKRTKGWKMPPNTIYVGRPTKWGSPFTQGPPAYRVSEYRRLVKTAISCGMHYSWHELRGKNLACWCPMDRPCHADVLLEIANT